MGRLLIAVGDALHWFRPNNPGPLYFDGENVTVGEQPTLTAKATDASLVEYGHLTLAKKVSKPEILPNGAAANIEYFEHGVQSVREIGFGEMLGLTSDPANGSVRVDVIQPESRDLIKKGLPQGLRRLGYVESPVQSTCGQQLVKGFIDYQGAVFDESEILVDRETGLNPVLVVVKRPHGYTYAIGTEKFVDSEGIPYDQALEEDAKIVVLTPIYGDDECPTKVTGYRRIHVPMPKALASDGRKGEWVAITPLSVATFTGSSPSDPEELTHITCAEETDVPEGAYAVTLMVKSFADVSTGFSLAEARAYPGTDPSHIISESISYSGAKGKLAVNGMVPLDSEGRFTIAFRGSAAGCTAEVFITGFLI